jgi:hypothetical protein
MEEARATNRSRGTRPEGVSRLYIGIGTLIVLIILLIIIF